MSYLYGGTVSTAQRSPYAAAGTLPPTHSPYAATSPVGAPPRSPYAPAGGLGPAGYVPSAAASTFQPGYAAPASTLSAHGTGATIYGASPMAAQSVLPAGTASTLVSPTQASQPFGANVQAGAVTYTTTTDQLGRVTYHVFKAEPSTYQSPQGVTYTGIQWVPMETSTFPPAGVAPAGPDILASFRGQLPSAPPKNMPEAYPTPPMRDYNTELKEKEEHRRRKKEEKAAARRAGESWEAERMAREIAEEKEVRKARERDAAREVEAERAARLRRRSVGTGLGSGYERSRSRPPDALRERELRDREERDLDRRMGDMNISGRGGYGASDYTAPPISAGTRSRRQSVSNPGGAAAFYDEPTSAYDRDADDDYGRYAGDGRRRTSIYGAPERERDRDREDYYRDHEPRRASIYATTNSDRGLYGPAERERDREYERERRSRPNSMYAGAERSPYRRGDQLPTSVVDTRGQEVYPPGHIFAGQPIIPDGTAPRASGGLSAPSRGASPGPYPGAVYGASPRAMPGNLGLSPRAGPVMMPSVTSPRVGAATPLVGGFGGPGLPQEQLLASPEAFNRAINRNLPFTPFPMLKIQNMDDFLDDLIRPQPAVLSSHDVQPEDWGRFMNDLMLAWKGQLPLPDGPVKRSDLVIDLLDLWNNVYFVPRRAEVVLYKGRNPRSGLSKGAPEAKLTDAQLAYNFSEDSGSDSESDEEYPVAGSAFQYHQQNYGSKRHAQEKAAKRIAKVEEKVRKELELKNQYTLWVVNISAY